MDPIRIGRITSSEIVALTTNGKAKDSFGKPFYTYIKQCNWERKLGKSLDAVSYAKALTWGRLLEPYVHNKLGTEYTLVSDQTIVHPKVPDWCGSPDGGKENEIEGDTVTDIKNPSSLTSFCGLVEPLQKELNGMDAMNWLRENHSDGEKYYWQICSNGILKKAKYGELIVHIPYEDELDDIKMLVQKIDDPSVQRQFYWVHTADYDELPSIKRDSGYNSLNIIRFEIPEVDKKFLTKRVYQAVELLDPWPEKPSKPV